MNLAIQFCKVIKVNKYGEIEFNKELKNKKKIIKQVNNSINYLKNLLKTKITTEIAEELSIFSNNNKQVDTTEIINGLANSLIERDQRFSLVFINSEIHHGEVSSRFAVTTGFEFGGKDYDMIIFGNKTFNLITPILTHELGHLFHATDRTNGIENKRGPHCVNKECIMHSPDEKPEEFMKKVNEKISKNENVFCELCINEMKKHI